MLATTLSGILEEGDRECREDRKSSKIVGLTDSCSEPYFLTVPKDEPFNSKWSDVESSVTRPKLETT
jgi:hypothetical protein